VNVNEAVRDRSISHAVYMERYKTQVVSEILEAMSDSETALVAEIRRRLDDRTFTKVRLERLLESVRDIIDDANVVLREKLRETIKDFGEREAGWMIQMLGDEIPVELDFTRPSPRQIYSAVIDRPIEDRMIGEAMRGIGPNQRRRVAAALRRGFIEGRTVQEITRDIRGTRAARYTDGILAKTRREIEGLVRTSINHTHSVARDELYKENDDLIKGVQWVATLDKRTTLICANRDGQVFPVDSGPRPPAHWNCRSTTTPVLKSWRELGIDLDEAPAGTRASMDGQVSDATTYEDWLKRQDAETQREVLGAKRYEKWKDGESLSGFVKDDRTLTLEELERSA